MAGMAWRTPSKPMAKNPVSVKLELRNAVNSRMKVSVGIAIFHSVIQRFASLSILMPKMLRTVKTARMATPARMPLGQVRISSPSTSCINPSSGQLLLT